MKSNGSNNLHSSQQIPVNNKSAFNEDKYNEDNYNNKAYNNSDKSILNNNHHTNISNDYIDSNNDYNQNKNQYNMMDIIDENNYKDFNHNTLDDNNTESDDLISIELQLENLFKLFRDSTDHVLAYANLKKGLNEPDMKNDKLNMERIEYERLDVNKFQNFENTVNDYSNKIISLVENIEESIDKLPNKEEYSKTESELKEELKSIKILQQNKINSINESVELAQETLKTIEQGLTKIDMFQEIMN